MKKSIVQYGEQHYTDFGLNHWDVFDRKTGETVGYVTEEKIEVFIAEMRVSDGTDGYDDMAELGEFTSLDNAVDALMVRFDELHRSRIESEQDELYSSL